MSEDKWSHIRKFLGESGEDILIYHYIQCVICNVINRKNRCYTSCYTRLDAVQKPPFPGASECKYGVRTTDRALTITVFTDIGAVGTVIFLCAGKPWNGYFRMDRRILCGWKWCLGEISKITFIRKSRPIGRLFLSLVTPVGILLCLQKSFEARKNVIYY